MPARKHAGALPAAVAPPRYEVRCRPQFANWGIFEVTTGLLVQRGSKELMHVMCSQWNHRDPFRGGPVPALPDPGDEETPREEWPQL